jgi:hypothetical protein
MMFQVFLKKKKNENNVVLVRKEKKRRGHYFLKYNLLAHIQKTNNNSCYQGGHGDKVMDMINLFRFLK